MRNFLTFDGRLVSRSGVARHALSATTLLLVGFLVVALAQLGGGTSASTINRGQTLPTCSDPGSTTAAAYEFGAHPKTVTVTKTKTKTVTKTRTKTVCHTRTVTQPGTTSTVTATAAPYTTTVTEGSTKTETVTTTAPGPTTTVTVTATATQPGSGTAFTCPPADTAGFPLGKTDYTSDPIFCSYPAVPDEDPNDFFCKYNASTGVLATDNDAGFCPAAAPPKP